MIDGLDADFERELKKCFIGEATDLLEKLEQQLLDLENEPSNEENLSAVFRTAHTLKGSGLSAGYQDLGNFCHNIENLLDNLRKQKTQMSTQVVDVLLQSFDILRAVIAELQKNWKNTGFEGVSPELIQNTLVWLDNPESRENSTPRNVQRSKPKSKIGDEVIKNSVDTALAQLSAQINKKSQAIAVTIEKTPINGILASEVAVAQMPAVSCETEKVSQFSDSKVYSYDALEWQLNSRDSTGALKLLTPDDHLSLVKLVFLSNRVFQPNDRSLGILDALIQHPRFHHVARVCIARRIGSSHELKIVDSSDLNVTSKVLFPESYSCFVANSSSLFSIPKNHYRICDRIDSVLETYDESRLPSQKSIERINRLGYKSSLCIPIEAEGHIVGFLFLNSPKEGYFGAMTKSDKFLLACAQNNAKLALLSQSPLSGDHYLTNAARLNLNMNHAPYSENTLKIHLKAHFEAWPTVEFNIYEHCDSNFLLNHAHLAYLTAMMFRTGLQFQPNLTETNCQIDFERSDDKLKIKISFFCEFSLDQFNNRETKDSFGTEGTNANLQMEITQEMKWEWDLAVRALNTQFESLNVDLVQMRLLENQNHEKNRKLKSTSLQAVIDCVLQVGFEKTGSMGANVRVDYSVKEDLAS